MSHSRQLEVNVNGAWKHVMPFGFGELALDAVKSAAQALHEVSPATAWRITTTSREPRVLGHMGRNTYGLWVMKGDKPE